MSTEAAFERNSRLILAVGATAHQRIRNLKVGVVGLTPTGTEIVKNLLLTGAGTVEVRDSASVTNFDVGSNFFLRPKDLGRPRLDVLIKRLASLNPGSEIKGSSEPVSDSWIKGLHSVVVAELRPYSELLRISRFCHENGIQFIFSVTVGPCSVLFEDFGDHFLCENVGGVSTKKAAVEMVFNSETPMIAIESAYLDVDFPVGSTVTFEDVAGMPRLNGQMATIKKKAREGQYRININTKGWEPFDKSAPHGLMVSVPRSAEITHKPLEAALGNGISNMGWGTEAYPKIRDLIMEICKFMDEEHRLPGIMDEADAERVAKNVDMDKEVAKRVVMCSGVEYPPNIGIVGGAGAQEAIKFCSKSFLPTTEQWFVVDHSKVMNWTQKPTLQNNRYDAIACVIGNELSEKLRRCSALVVGVGAIGCEFARYVALFGFEKIMMVDNDTVEPSNLTRQFLFRDKHRHMSKAEVGRHAVLKANPDIRPENLVAVNSYFDRDMLSKLPFKFDIVFSAVDSVKSRLFIFGYTWLHDLPMVNGGMTQAVGDFQVFIPHRTRPFTMKEQDTEQIPACTLKNRPTRSVHIVQFVQNEFVRLFQTKPQSALKCIANVAGADEICLKQGVGLLANQPKTFTDCVQWAFSKFTKVMENDPTLMLRLHPEGSLASNGRPYWEENIKPKIIRFDPANPMHTQLVVSAARLKAQVHNIEVSETDLQNAGEIIKTCKKPAIKESTIVDILKLREQFAALGDLSNVKITPLDFNKDDPLHMDYIEAYSITRGDQTGITVTYLSRLDLMKMVGNIAPTMATTTAVVGAGACAAIPMIFDESQKDAKLPLDGDCSLIGLKYRVGVSMSPPRTRKIPNSTEKFCVWDLVDIRGNPLVKDVIEKYDDPIGEYIEWCFDDRSKDDISLDSPINDAIEKALGYKADRYVIFRYMDADNGTFIDLPALRVIVNE